MRESNTDNKTAKCPICGKDADKKYFPFCSSRCADHDLHRWLSGCYTVPQVECDEDDFSTIPDEDHSD